MASAVSVSLDGDSTRVLPRYFRMKVVSGAASASGPVRLLLALALVLPLPLDVDGPTDSQLLARAHSSHSSATKAAG